MVLRGEHRDGAGAVGEHEERELFAGHELLDEDLAPGIAEGLRGEHRDGGSVGVLDALADEDALPRREPGRLDHDRRTERADGEERAVECGVRFGARGGHAGVAHQLLREGLRRFDARGGARRAEDGELLEAECIHESGGERRLGPNDREVGTLAQREIEERAGVRRLHRGAAAELRQPRVARGGDDVEGRMTPRERPGEGVLAPAAADQQHLHFGVDSPGGAPLPPRWRKAPETISLRSFTAAAT